MIGRGVVFRGKESGFIRVGAVIFILAILILLRVHWGIDISEPANELFERANNLTSVMVESVKDLFNR